MAGGGGGGVNQELKVWYCSIIKREGKRRVGWVRARVGWAGDRGSDGCEKRRESIVHLNKMGGAGVGGGEDVNQQPSQVKRALKIYRYFTIKNRMNNETSKFEEFMSPAKKFLEKNKESSENVNFTGVTLTRYPLSTYVDSNNAWKKRLSSNCRKSSKKICGLYPNHMDVFRPTPKYL